MTSGRKSNGGTTVALMSCGIKTATELLWARRWTTGRSTIYEIILRIPYRVKSSAERDGPIIEWGRRQSLSGGIGRIDGDSPSIVENTPPSS
jgi:hypothetical protein